NDSLVHVAKRQAMTDGRANTYPAAYTELAPGEPTSEGSLCGFADVLPLLQPSRSAQSRASNLPLNRHLIYSCLHRPPSSPEKIIYCRFKCALCWTCRIFLRD